MVDNQAEDDDDESFGDFKYVSYPNQPTYSNQMNGNSFPAVDGDDWSDFVNSTKQINGGLEPETLPSQSPSTISRQVSADHSNNLSPQLNKLSQIVLAPRPADLEKSRWTKPQGALPLSIFGAEEEDEPTTSNPAFANGANTFFNKNGDSMKNGSDSNGAFRINDMISNLYNQSPQLNSDNGSISILKVPDLNASGASSNGNSLISAITASPPNPDANGLNSNISNLNSDSVDGCEDIDDDEDGWEFKCAEPEIQIKSDNIEFKETKRGTDWQVGSAFGVGFGNGTYHFGNMLDLSNGISHKVDEQNMGFDFNLLPNHTAPKLGQENKSNNNKIGLNLVNENFEEFKDAFSESRSKCNLEATKLADIYPTREETFKFDDEGPPGPIDQSHVSNEISLQSDEWGFGFNFNHPSLGEDRHISESYSMSKQDDNNQNFNTASTNTNVDSDVQLFKSSNAVTEIGIQHEKSQISSENRREALPVSIFGDDTPDTDDHSVDQDFSSYVPTSSIKNSFNSPNSNLPINDLIWNLYSQAEHKASPYSTAKAMENGIHETPAVLHPNLVNSEDDFDGDSWEFVGVSSGTRLDAQKTLSSLAQEVSINGSQPFAVLNSELSNGDDGFENDSWEFKDSSSGARSQDQASVIDQMNSSLQSSVKLESLGYVDLYCKLKDELCNVILCHLQNLKKAQSIAAVSGEDVTAKTLQEQIQEFSVMLYQDDIIPKEYLSENHSPRNMSLGQLLELLKEPKFQSLESEYQLTSRLSLAEKDIISAIELLKHGVSTLRIFELGSREEQSNYLTTWSKIASVCSRELKHGAFIWRESVQKNVHDQILSNPEGIRYFKALGEIYRVAEIVGTSAKLYKPWVLSGSADTTRLFSFLNDCNAAWSSSGLEEALSSIMSQSNSEHDGISRELFESIKYIHELDELVLQSYIICGPETCQLSALPADIIPGLKIVAWNGKQYYLTVANLWANLISSDPPK
ncbi:hypothetical protein L6164_035050 [Bauhinia variegata]|uniref:Uncharacterized protein n=1 Tax=Bauhinia variegata TaxID=167791 RepID=A0ACB9KXM1_BAUVA|nr:hypothetical protein L6164_035050 [Bauhinia variegata]